MSTIDIQRRVARLERKRGRRVAADGRDPDLVQLAREIYGDRFRLEMVPLGQTLGDFMASLSGRVAGVSRLPAG